MCSKTILNIIFIIKVIHALVRKDKYSIKKKAKVNIFRLSMLISRCRYYQFLFDVF